MKTKWEEMLKWNTSDDKIEDNLKAIDVPYTQESAA